MELGSLPYFCLGAIEGWENAFFTRIGSHASYTLQIYVGQFVCSH